MIEWVVFGAAVFVIGLEIGLHLGVSRVLNAVKGLDACYKFNKKRGSDKK